MLATQELYLPPEHFKVAETIGYIQTALGHVLSDPTSAKLMFAALPDKFGSFASASRREHEMRRRAKNIEHLYATHQVSSDEQTGHPAQPSQLSAALPTVVDAGATEGATLALAANPNTDDSDDESLGLFD